MKQSALEKKRNSFSIDSIIAGDRSTTETGNCSPAASRLDTRAYGPPAQLPPIHSRSIPADNSRLPDPSLQARTAAVAGMVPYDEREVVMRQRSMFDYGRYPSYDHAVAQFAAAAAAMATMTSCPGAVDTSVRAVSDPLNYTYWTHANRHHTPPGLFLPGTPSSDCQVVNSRPFAVFRQFSFTQCVHGFQTFRTLTNLFIPKHFVP